MWTCQTLGRFVNCCNCWTTGMGVGVDTLTLHVESEALRWRFLWIHTNPTQLYVRWPADDEHHLCRAIYICQWVRGKVNHKHVSPRRAFSCLRLVINARHSNYMFVFKKKKIPYQMSNDNDILVASATRCLSCMRTHAAMVCVCECVYLLSAQPRIFSRFCEMWWWWGEQHQIQRSVVKNDTLVLLKPRVESDRTVRDFHHIWIWFCALLVDCHIYYNFLQFYTVFIPTPTLWIVINSHPSVSHSSSISSNEGD